MGLLLSLASYRTVVFLWFQTEASVLPENLLEMWILKTHQQTFWIKLGGWEPICTKPPGDSGV